MSKDHVFSAVRAAADRAEARADGAEPVEQLDLLPTRFDPKLDPLERGKQADAVARNDRGRPKGATNLATREMLAFIRQTIGDPMLESARWAMHTPETLARELGCDKLEAFDRLQKIRSDLLPYFYAKQAPVDADGKPVPGLTMQIGGHAAAQLGHGGDDVAPWLRYQEPPTDHEKAQQNQRVIDVTPSVSHGKASHESG